jgi:hypothetical protein
MVTPCVNTICDRIAMTLIVIFREENWFAKRTSLSGAKERIPAGVMRHYHVRSTFLRCVALTVAVTSPRSMEIAAYRRLDNSDFVAH